MRDIDPDQLQNSDTYNYLYSILIHDLRTSLSCLDTAMQVLKSNIDEALIGSSLYSILDATASSSRALTYLLEDLFVLLRSPNTYLIADKYSVDLRLLIDDILILYATSIEEKKIEIDIEITTQNKEFYIDKEIIKSCVRNFIYNAIKYSYKGDKIQIKIKENESSLVFSVQDQGCGIPYNIQDKIRNGERIVSTKGTSNEKGAGWGLFIIKNILDINGGDFWFESQPDVGSIFSFSIPKTINK